MKYSILAFVLVVFSCQEKNSEYESVLSRFDSSVVNHFPQNALNEVNDFFVKDYYHYHNTESLILMRDLKKEVMDSLLKMYSQNLLNEANDSCLIVVNDFLTKQNMGTPSIGRKSSFKDCDSYNIIPNFFELDFEDTKSSARLPKDFNQYIIKSEKGNFSKDIDFKISSMPDSFLHGYSKGFAISKERMKVIYWTIIW